ncbi:hypothetical protein JCM19992_29630 [Thermostilla marina]
MIAEVTTWEFARAVEATAVDLLTEAGIDRPPVDAFVIAKHLNITVVFDRRQSERARLVRLHTAVSPGSGSGTTASSTAYELAACSASARTESRPSNRPVIALKPEERPERLHWAVAHELGETLAWKVFAQLSADIREVTPHLREATANRFANSLMLPERWFFDDAVACDWDLPVLKRRYTTASHELIARRMLDHPSPKWVTIVDHGRITFRRGNGGRVPRALLIAERKCWERTHTTGNRTALAGEGVRVVAWPIHEPDWKREIVLTRPREDGDPCDVPN